MPEELVLDSEATAEALSAFIRQAAAELQRDGAVVGLSGGIDSAVVATLAVRALGRERVLGVILPERDSAPESARLARQLARQLGIRSKKFWLTPSLALIGAYWQVPLWLLPGRRLQTRMVRRYYAGYRQTLGEGETPFSTIMIGTRGKRGPWLNQTVAYHRVKVRLRTVLLHYYAELHNLLVLGCANKTELSVGLFVRWGDVAADATPLAGLYKTQVRLLASHLNVPEGIIARPPSPDVLPGLNDEEAMGLPYVILDRVLWRLERGLSEEAIAEELELSPDLVRYVKMLTSRARQLRAPPRVPEG